MSVPRAFVRSEGVEEEVTPPTANQRVSSFDSLSAATALCTQLPASAPSPPDDSEKDSPGSPTVAAAAAVLNQVQSTDVLEGAVDCLMSFSSHAAADSTFMPPKKRPAPAASTTRRKLKMRAGPSPLSRSGDAGSSTMEPVSLLSSSNVGQLKLLAAAFKICPTPTDEQIGAIASRVDLEPDVLSHWFHQRRVLQEWVQQQPHVSSSSIREMFYSEQEPQMSPEGLAPMTSAPWREVGTV